MPWITLQAAAMSRLQTEPQSFLAMRPFKAQAEQMQANYFMNDYQTSLQALVLQTRCEKV